jgi:DNA invertase Pin-like site-specific DNA recombinase
MTLRAAIYARVSSQAQRDKHTIENQLRLLPAFVASQGWTLAGTYVDDGRSAKAGQLDARDGFAALLRDAELRRFDRGRRRRRRSPDPNR